MNKNDKLYDLDTMMTEPVDKWVHGCEKDFFERLDAVANAVCTSDRVRLLRLSGPTCSGKTTAANLLRSRFAEMGKNLHLVSIDDFYYDKDYLHARSGSSESEEVDYDSVHTIDLDALKDFTEEIFTQERSHCPVFDFKAGKRVSYRLMESGPDDVFIFEGIQAVYPEVTEIFESNGHSSVGIYISPERSIKLGDVIMEPNEIRLMRRLVRDYNFRGTLPEATFGLWAGVRRNEEANIMPYAKSCKYRIDSTMPYELGILKPYLEKILATVPTQSVHRAAADTILAEMSKVSPISSELILPDSLYKDLKF